MYQKQLCLPLRLVMGAQRGRRRVAATIRLPVTSYNSISCLLRLSFHICQFNLECRRIQIFEYLFVFLQSHQSNQLLNWKIIFVANAKANLQLHATDPADSTGSISNRIIFPFARPLSNFQYIVNHWNFIYLVSSRLGL